jgi:hypothetical protein
LADGFALTAIDQFKSVLPFFTLRSFNRTLFVLLWPVQERPAKIMDDSGHAKKKVS